MINSFLKKRSKTNSFKLPQNFDDIYNFTHDGVYILGLLYSQAGSIIDKNTIIIKQDKEFSGVLLNRLSERLSGDLYSPKESHRMSVLYVNSSTLVNFILGLGGIGVGEDFSSRKFPSIPKDKVWSFICGFFDGSGVLTDDNLHPTLTFCGPSTHILSQIALLLDKHYTAGELSVSGYKALDVCGKMYKDVSIKNPFKYNVYINILNKEVLPDSSNLIRFKYKKLSNDAIEPTKNRVTDSGYDLHAVEITYDKDIDLYKANTKIAIEPIRGWYFDLVGRSSLPKTGFMFVGGVGIIDRSYTGPVIMLLKKIRGSAEIPELPFKLGQIIPRRIMHADFIEVENLSESDRQSAGFGSSGH